MDVHTEDDGVILEKNIKRPIPAAPEVSGLPPSWSLRNVAAGAPTSRSHALHPETEPEAPPMSIHIAPDVSKHFHYRYLRNVLRTSTAKTTQN